MVEKIESYENLGPPKFLGYVEVFNKYYVNPTSRFYTNELGEEKLYLSDVEVPKNVQLMINFPMDRFNVSGGTFLAFEWNCESIGFYGKYLVNGRQTIY